MFLFYNLYNGLLFFPRLAAAPLEAWFGHRDAATADPGTRAAEWAQRLGYGLGRLGRSPVWIQAASVGEVRIAARVIDAIGARRPDLTITLTTTTRTGQALAKKLSGAGPSERVRAAFFPLDFPAAVRRALSSIEPRVFVMIETEIWPNLLRECQRAGVRPMILNGRLSSRSYARYRRVRPLMRRALGYLDLACVQTREDEQRFVSLGLDPKKIIVTGNIKYDLPSPASPQAAAAFRRELGLPDEDPLIVAGSTADGEDPLVIEAFRTVRAKHPRARLLLAPRHPERFASAEATARKSGFLVGRRTERACLATPAAASGAPANIMDVIVLDTMGELPLAYAAAQVAFVGGSLVAAGGQNMLEPAACALAPIFGRHTENFREPAERLLGAGGAVRVDGPEALAEELRRAIDDPDSARAAGERARAALKEGAGAARRCVEALLERL